MCVFVAVWRSGCVCGSEPVGCEFKPHFGNFPSDFSSSVSYQPPSPPSWSLPILQHLLCSDYKL